MKKSYILFALIVITLLLASCTPEKTTNTTIVNINDDSKAPVEAFGTIKSLKDRHIYIRYPSKIKEINVVNGEKVSLGQAIATIDKSQYLLQKKQKESYYRIKCIELEKAQEQLMMLREEIIVDTFEMNKLAIQLEVLEKEYAELESKLLIKQQLYDNATITLDEYKESEVLVKNKSIEIEKVKLSIDELKLLVKKQNKENEANAKIMENDIAIYKENVRIAKEELDAFSSTFDEEYIKNQQIVSDIENGIIYNLNFVEGDMIDGNSKLCTIMDADNIVAEVYVSEEYIKDVKLNAFATIFPMADKSKSYLGKVSFISSYGFSQNGEVVYPVQITFKNGKDFLQPQFSVDVQIKTE